jgi:hypothetical protein
MGQVMFLRGGTVPEVTHRKYRGEGVTAPSTQWYGLLDGVSTHGLKGLPGLKETGGRRLAMIGGLVQACGKETTWKIFLG